MPVSRGDIDSAEGVSADVRGAGIGHIFQAVAPTNGAVGYMPGCTWVNQATGLVYMNVGTFASATWIENDPGNGNQLIFGGSTSATMTSQGTLYRNFGSGTAPASASGGVSAAAAIIVDFFTLPASSFDKALRNLNIAAGGSITGSDASAVQIQTTATLPVIGSTITSGTVIATTGSMSLSASGWGLTASIWKYGAAGSNTQAFQETGTVAGTTHGGVGAPGTLTYTESSPIYIVVTIGVTTTAADCKLWWWDIAGQN